TCTSGGLEACAASRKQNKLKAKTNDLIFMGFVVVIFCLPIIVNRRKAIIMMRVAAAQMSSTSDRSTNLAKTHALLGEALSKDCDLIAFPETFNLLTEGTKSIQEAAETLKGVTVETLREGAIEAGI